MEFMVQSAAAEKYKTDCLVIGVSKKSQPTIVKTLDVLSKGYLNELLKKGDLNFKPGHSLMLHHLPEAVCERLLLVSLGEKRSSLVYHSFKKMAVNLSDQLKDCGIKEAVIVVDGFEITDRDLYYVIRQLVEIFEYQYYQFNQFKSSDEKQEKKNKTTTLKKITFLVGSNLLTEAQKAVAHGLAIGNGRNVARTLGNLPANICHPTYLANEAKTLAKQHSKVSTKILTEKHMSQLGMNSFLSVSAGSDQEAKLICIEFKNGLKTAKPLVILGKGITFDSGGISLKPGAGMDEMKFDMCGAACIFGVMTALVELDLPLNVVGMVASAENMPGSKATRPGDIVTSMSGKTIEILNTDAEGRLVLCDALSYAERFQPEAVIDVATLTGACIVALGRHTSGLLSNNPSLAKELVDASNMADDPAWQLPMGEEYSEQLDSNFADLANIGGPDAGTITAACFLAKFAESYPWAHLDIAGTAWKKGKAKGATGRPVPMLVEFLLSRIKD